MPGHVEKRGKYYLIVIDLGRDSQGERIRKFHKTDMTRKTDAEKLMIQILSEVETGLYVEPNKITVAEFLRKWVEEYARKKLAIRTYTCYEQIFELHVIPHLGHLPLKKLKPLHLEKYYTEMLESGRLDNKEGGLSPNSVLKHHRILHKALRTAVRWELISLNPADNAEAPKKVDPEMSYYEPGQAIAMLEAAEGTEHFGEVVVATYSGARRGEVYGLRWEDVDWKNNLLKIRQTVQYTAEEGIFFKEPKSKKGKRDIEVPALVIDFLREHKVLQNKKKLAFDGELEDNDLVFC